ncbi:MAG: hypothetical protein QXK65_00180 [Candidatus Micrarchaeaceae archaeon]
MSDEINFVDIMALSKIGPDSVVEKFGGLINSSFFDASNILGTLKVKGLINFTTAFPGQSAITVTESGKQLMNEAESKANEPFDLLDFTLLTQLSGGKKTLADLSGAVNLRPRDIALHLYKLMRTEYITSNFRNGLLDIALTEKGFLKVKAGMTQAPGAAAKNNQADTGAAPQPLIQQGGSASFQGAAAVSESQLQQPQPNQAAPQPESEVERLIKEARKKKARRNLILFIIVVLVLIALIVMAKMRLI